MRLFLAIEIPPAVREHLCAVQTIVAPLAPRATLTTAANLHLTVKFLGEVSDAKFDSLIDSLQKVGRPGVVDLTAVGLECFGSGNSIRVVGATIGGDLRALTGLNRSLEQRCQYLNIPAEARAFRPHITLARSRSGLPSAAEKELQAACQAQWPGPTFTAASFCLMQSVLLPSGAEYRQRHSFPIGE